MSDAIKAALAGVQGGGSPLERRSQGTTLAGSGARPRSGGESRRLGVQGGEASMPHANSKSLHKCALHFVRVYLPSCPRSSSYAIAFAGSSASVSRKSLPVDSASGRSTPPKDQPKMTETSLEKAQRKFEQAKAALDAIKARENAADRKKDTRRKIVLGGALLELARTDKDASAMVTKLIAGLVRDHDKKLFEKKEKTEAEKASVSAAPEVGQ
ncbi:hypothetical protein [Rhodoblastus sp.]|uniref:hypothetical protein n=2 Tax=Rhodoblastus sp. TaxID=1962975 RepID=UPI003FD86DBA